MLTIHALFWGVLLSTSLVTIQASNLGCNNILNIDFKTIDDYSDHMCMVCFSTMINDATSHIWNNFDQINQWDINPDINRIKYSKWSKPYRMNYTEIINYNGNFSDHLILGQFIDDFYVKILRQCCQDAYNCCEKMSHIRNDQINNRSCPMKWDGWACWDQALPGSVNHLVCPDITMFLLDYLPPTCVRSNAIKECDSNGSWSLVEWYGELREHTDYTQCSIQAKSNRLNIVYTTVVFHAISLFCIVVGLSLFIFYRLYTKFRIQIHINFFASIALSSLMTIIYNIMITKAHIDKTNAYVYHNDEACKTFTFLFKDLRLINYCWMLIEGFNFHHVIAFFFNQKQPLSQYKLYIYLIGWAFPNLVMLIYTAIRINVENDRCWTNLIGNYEWVYLSVPYLCFAVNFALFANLIRVIVMKLLIRTKNRHSHFVKQGVTKSLVLMPIFGFQYILHFVPVDPAETCNPVELSLEYFQVVVEGLQGLIIATALCFLNNDVHTCVKRSIRIYTKPLYSDSSSKSTSVHTLSVD